MRIQEVIQITGLTKKAIHFYIEKNLINPTKNSNNGYYDLDDEDLRKLKLICLFRQIGFSIETIQEIFTFPTMTNYFFHRQVNLLKHKIIENQKQLENLCSIIEAIPPNATPEYICDNYSISKLLDEPTNNYIETLFPCNDARMIAILILAPFLDIHVDEYRKFLWDRISSELQLQFKDNLIYLQRIIYSQSAIEINTTSSQSYKLFMDLSISTSFEEFQQYLMQRCHELINNQSLLLRWTILYQPILLPLQGFYKNISELMSAYSPRYESCNKKLNILVNDVARQIKNDSLFYEQIMTICPLQELTSSLYLIFWFSYSFISSCPEPILQDIKRKSTI
ncbi:MerR family transcriptional regulator [Anaerorhabdus sp.]|uniref:MerR family transcriptional regulator n=1 Tax=Anaerorhabdus sp. TaxID=1872524 RepID=UPI002FCBCF1E